MTTFEWIFWTVLLFFLSPFIIMLVKSFLRLLWDALMD